MPKKPELQAVRVATALTGGEPDVPVYSRLTMEERERLVEILKDKAFIKAWRNAECAKPPIFPGDPEKHEGEHGDNRAAKALARLQGWEMHKAAIIRQSIEIVPKPKVTPAEYPPSGTLEAEIQRTLPKTK